jgi:phage anti-repressor protein
MSDQDKASGASPAVDGVDKKEDNSDQLVKKSDLKRALDDMMKFKNLARELQSKLEDVQKKDQELEEKKLVETGEFKKILELKERQLSEYQQKLKEKEESEGFLKKTLFDSAKLNAVMERLPAKLKHPDYRTFLNIDKVILDPESHEINLDSVNEVVNDFMKTHHHLLDADKKTLPNNAALSAQKISYEDWLKLPAKDKKIRMKDVVNK